MEGMVVDDSPRPIHIHPKGLERNSSLPRRMGPCSPRLHHCTHPRISLFLQHAETRAFPLQENCEDITSLRMSYENAC
jgi:hypothetical protein